ncbi:zinc-dependent metalloprotease [Quadrisphaera sp. GCM10027208]|uniref:zinc-dependent metalloprotease n=1 Tax=Quadrisphaera sp. GCM10027208 TaxID=3273423 RepID=UPI00361294DC
MTTTASTAAVDALVDWDLALAAATRLTRPGPQVSRAEAADVVAVLRADARRSTPLVEQVTGLSTQPGEDVLVVDRPGWVRANVEAFRTLLAPVVEEAAGRRGGSLAPLVGAVGSRVTGAEMGSLLAFLSSRVLGQYDVFHSGGGRLLLVAPNVVHAERELAADPADFRLWVCLHEETHRVQFTASPWLRDHLTARVRALVSDLLGEPGAVLERVLDAVGRLPDVVRGDAATGLLDVVQTPEQRRALAEVTAVMSLLEGHADVVMDEVGPSVIPSVATIRRQFSRRRSGRSAPDRLLRRLLGLDAKMRQYTDGAVFVRSVVDDVGTTGFNRVWDSPDTLPTPEEIADPAGWVARVHG